MPGECDRTKICPERPDCLRYRRQKATKVPRTQTVKSSRVLERVQMCVAA